MLDREEIVLEIFLVLFRILENIAEFPIHSRFSTAIRFWKFGNFFLSAITHHQWSQT